MPFFRRHPPLLVWSLVAVALLFLAGSFLALRLWFHPLAPRVVRMLPPGETLAYLDLEPLRAAGLLDEALPQQIETAPAYAAFLRGSGFDFARDLDALACSLQGAPLRPSQTTCVLEGEFTPRFQQYLQANARQHRRLDGLEAFVFPGWTRPQQPIWVVQLDSYHLLVTNAPESAALVRHSRSWWHRSPPLWNAPLFAPAPIGFIALDALHLAAARQLDGSRVPWRGATRLQVRLFARFDASLDLEGQEQTLDSSDAASTRAWAQSEIASLRPLLPAAEPGRLSVRALLDRLELRQRGNRLEFTLRLDPASLQSSSPTP